MLTYICFDAYFSIDNSNWPFYSWITYISDNCVPAEKISPYRLIRIIMTSKSLVSEICFINTAHHNS